MRNAMVPAAVATLLLAASPSAKACGTGCATGYEALVAIVLAAGAADLAFTAWDVGSAIAWRAPSPAYGLIEALVAAPQIAVGLNVAQDRPGARWYPIWMAALTAHGLFTMGYFFANAGNAPPRAALQSVSVGPTYVPLGPLAQPGVGIAGRF